MEPLLLLLRLLLPLVAWPLASAAAVGGVALAHTFFATGSGDRTGGGRREEEEEEEDISLCDRLRPYFLRGGIES